MTIKIERGVPIPETAHQIAHEIKGMVPGDSFFIAGCTAAQRALYYRAAATLPHFYLVTAVATVAGETPEAPPVNGLRFWRVAAKFPRKYEPKKPE